MGITPGLKFRSACGADLNARQSRAFVICQIEDGIEANHLEEHHHALGGREVGGFATSPFQSCEGANQRADSGTVEFGDAGKVHRNVGRATVDKFLNFVAKRLFGVAEFKSSIKIQNRGVASLPNADIHMSLTAMCKANRIALSNQGVAATRDSGPKPNERLVECGSRQDCAC